MPDGETDRFIITGKSHKQKRPTGTWDDTILCRECEKKYQHIDSNAAQILLKDFDSLKIPFNDKLDTAAIQVSKEHLKSIKTFLIYTLWKASVSSREEFKSIKLGPYEERIKNDIISGKDFKLEEYGFIGCYIENPIGALMPFKRIKKDYQRCTFYCLDFSTLMFDIKIDSRKMPSTYKEILEHENLVFLKMKNPPKKKHQAMIDIIKEHDKKFGKPT